MKGSAQKIKRKLKNTKILQQRRLQQGVAAKYGVKSAAKTPVKEDANKGMTKRGRPRKFEENEDRAAESAPVINARRTEGLMVKLFERKVDLSKYDDSTPLYPICRAWMLSNETETPKTEPMSSTKRMDNAEEVLAKLRSGEITEIYQMPEPKKATVPRIPPPLELDETSDFNDVSRIDAWLKEEEIKAKISLAKTKETKNAQDKTVEQTTPEKQQTKTEEAKEKESTKEVEEKLEEQTKLNEAELIQANDVDAKEKAAVKLENKVEQAELEIVKQEEETEHKQEDYSKEALLGKHMNRWKRVKTNWIQHSREYQKRYEINFAILDELYRKGK